ncbi:Glycoside-Pentoside-Hexuronide (GPH):Cation Symporter Family [Thraustotheca clavata]|uniref:Glycoside-Pentoside-Hexuronide (GPH):Cation Symporter Family n=1 Tax=Thraustotheca clavata TaxID=74557 RepID=A0A1V9YXL4_9STRA|nr:Glycoside-Pentoside-Hexuronide (GPH):Cation Symporter Family [Thraustotheca clavata]
MHEHLELGSPDGYNRSITPKMVCDYEEASNPEGCSMLFMLFLAAPKMAMNMAWAAQWAAFGPLLETMVPSWAVQLIQIIGPTTGLLVAPTVGVLSDTCTSSYGRRRPFLLFGALTSSLCWLIMMYAREIGLALGDHGLDQRWTAVFTIVCYIWMDISVNVTQTPVNLILADFAGCRQVLAASIGQAYSIAGSFCVSGYILIFGPAHESIHAFLWVLIAIMLATVLPVCIWAKETPLLAKEKHSRCKKVANAFAAVYTGLKTLPKELIAFCICFFLVQYGYTAYNGAKGQFFGLIVFGGEANGANACGSNCTPAQDAYNRGVRLAGGVTDTIFNVVGLVFMVLLPYLVRTFGAKLILTLSMLPQALLTAMAFSKIVELNVAIVVQCAITQNAVFAMQIPVILYVIGQGEENQLGLYAGAFNSANCAGQLINFAVASCLVQTSMGHALPVLVGGVLSLMAVLVSAFALRLTDM